MRLMAGVCALFLVCAMFNGILGAFVLADLINLVGV